MDIKSLPPFANKRGPKKCARLRPSMPAVFTAEKGKMMIILGGVQFSPAGQRKLFFIIKQ